MLPDPLHPAVVHLPLALAVLTPGLAALALVAIRRRLVERKIWAAVVLLQALLVGSTWLALETGEAEEERVEEAVAERYIEAHEESAERLMMVSALALIASAAGLLAGAPGGLARGATVVVALGVLAAGVRVGHSGGELVYSHGAANVYLQNEIAQGPRDFSAGKEHDPEEEEQDDD